MDYGAKVKLFPGVDTWFKRIREYGKSKGGRWHATASIKKMRSNKRDENEKLDTRKIQASYNLLIISKEKESY
jgi:hypothetical protein